jgi:TnpA family transposase
MNERIKELANKAVGKRSCYMIEAEYIKFAELIIKDCITIAKNWEDELENANSLSESNAAGIVAYRIARQFGVKE